MIGLLAAAATITVVHTGSPGSTCAHAAHCVYYLPSPGADDPIAQCLGMLGFTPDRGLYLVPERDLVGCANDVGQRGLALPT